jgi:hypothetical protein
MTLQCSYEPHVKWNPPSCSKTSNEGSGYLVPKGPRNIDLLQERTSIKEMLVSPATFDLSRCSIRLILNTLWAETCNLRRSIPCRPISTSARPAATSLKNFSRCTKNRSKSVRNAKKKHTGSFPPAPVFCSKGPASTRPTTRTRVGKIQTRAHHRTANPRRTKAGSV